MVVRFLAFGMGYVPLFLAEWIAFGCAWIWWLGVPVRRRLAVLNFGHHFPGVVPGPALRGMMASIITGYFELMRHLRTPVVRIDLENHEPLQARAALGLGTLVMMGHFGPWDLVGPLGAQAMKIPSVAAVKTPSSPAIARLMERVRRRLGLGLLPPKNSLPAMREALASGHLVGFFLDQRHNQGVLVNFLGRPALTSAALAKLAYETGTPVYGASFIRRGRAHYLVRFEGPWSMSGESVSDTQRLISFYDAAIRARPEAWLWLHNRWKTPNNPQGTP